MARCPCHYDKGPSLSIKDDNGKIIIWCFGCGAKGPDVAAALGMDVTDLFPPSDIDYDKYPQRKHTVAIGADQALYSLQVESTVIYMIADHMLRDGAIDDATKDRLRLACQRVHTVTALYKE